MSMLLVVLIGISAFLVFSQGSGTEAARQRTTDEALAMAKAALIGYAIARPLDPGEQQRRLGELPCPDSDNDGIADLTACTNESARIGRLPWKTLGLPDLRDGDGERLWYAVSYIYKSNPRTTCDQPEQIGCLNSDAAGSITVRGTDGSITHDARPSTPPTYGGAIGVIIAPGAVITRQDGVAQRRDDAASMALPVNYLDIAHGEDNADFVDNDGNGFIAGPVRTGATGQIIANDRIAVVTYEDVMPALENRVAREVGRCLDVYASVNQNRYPWATALNQVTIDVDAPNLRAGRVPQTFTNTRTSSADVMSSTWQLHPACFLGRGLRWWDEWKMHVFYAVDDCYKPGSTPPEASCTSNMFVRTKTSTTTFVYFVAVAGKRMPTISGGQPRTTSSEISTAANFLEAENATTFSNPADCLTGCVVSTVPPTTSSAPFNETAIVRLCSDPKCDP